MKLSFIHIFSHTLSFTTTFCNGKSTWNLVLHPTTLQGFNLLFKPPRPFLRYILMRIYHWQVFCCILHALFLMHKIIMKNIREWRDFPLSVPEKPTVTDPLKVFYLLAAWYDRVWISSLYFEMSRPLAKVIITTEVLSYIIKINSWNQH